MPNVRADFLLCFCHMVRNGDIPRSVVIHLIEEYASKRKSEDRQTTGNGQGPGIELAEAAA